MAASATSFSPLSSLSIRTSLRFSPLHHHHHQSPFLSTTFLAPNFQSLSLSNPSKTPKLNLLKCQAEDEEEEEREAPMKAIETIYYENDDPQGISTFDPPEMPDDFVVPPSFDDGPMEDEDQIAAAYEELYGPAYSGISVLGNDIYEMDSRVKKKSALGIVKKEKVRDGFDERVVQVRRVTKVVKGGKQMNFRAVVVVGDKKGQVGVGVGKATEVIEAVQKSAADARRNIITVPLTKYSTFPHRADGKYGAAKVMLRPASPGSGVLAGGSVKIVLDMAGVENALGKQLGSNNALNNARATIVAVSQMRQFSEVAQDRGIPMEELWK